MEIQLTRTKTITIGGGPKKRKPMDIVGIDLFGGDPRGCPAVRLTEKKGALRIAALGFLPPPAVPLPESWEAASKATSWSLPSPVQAPQAAIAVTSPDMFVAQTTVDAVRSDVLAGAHADGEAARPRLAGERKFGIRRQERPSAAPAAPAKAAKIEIRPGEPVSNGGMRFVMQALAGSTGFVMEAGLPEYQALWLSRLLPEGRRPTASSIQLAPAARTAAPILQPAFLKADGTAMVLFASPSGFDIAGYRRGELVLWRNCRGVPGTVQLRERLKTGLGLDDEMVDSALDDNLIDPMPVLEPLLAPVLDELAVSRDYLSGKLDAEPGAVLALGLRAGVSHWRALTRERAHLELTVPAALDGIERIERIHLGEGVKDDAAGSHDFTVALGAALAVYGEEAAQ